MRLLSVLLLSVVASPSLAQLECRVGNASFEAIAGSGFAYWNEVGTPIVESDLVVHGSRAMSATGPSVGDWAIEGVWQGVAAAPGEVWRASARVGHTPTDPLTGGCRAIMNVEWRDANDALISYETLDAANANTPTGTLWPQALKTGPAPSGTASARILLAILQPPSNDAGSAVFDMASLERVDPEPAKTEWPDFPGGREIDFAGYTWRVKGPGVFGPGPSYFSHDPSVVSVSSDGLRLGIDRVGGRWASTEVVLTEPLGYGEYRFTVSPDGGPRVGVPDDWDANVVLGLFVWQYTGCYSGYNPANRHNEFDVEVSRWGDPNAQLAQFVAQPYDFPGNIERFDASWAKGPVSFSFTWAPDRVECRAWEGGGDAPVDSRGVFFDWSYAGPHVPRPEVPRVHLNFWQLGGPPSSARAHSALISHFSFTPLCALDGVMERGADDLYEVSESPRDLDGDGLLTPTDRDCLEAWLRGRD